MVKRGQIYHDSQYIYPIGNIERKYLVILNKNHLPTQPIIAVPAHNPKNSKKYHPGCNHKVMQFFLRGTEDFFPSDTTLQLFILNSGNIIDESQFEVKMNKHIIEFSGILQKDTIDKLAKCLEQIQNDIPEELHIYLF